MRSESLKVTLDHVVDHICIERAGAVDTHDLETMEEEQKELSEETRRLHAEMYKAFTTPTSLRSLFLDPQRQAHNWVEALIFHQDHLPEKSQMRQAFHLGKPYRQFLGDVNANGSWWPYALVAIVYFLFHSPAARLYLRPRDCEFLCGAGVDNHNARSLMDAWIKGTHPTERRFIVSSDEAHMNHTITLGYNLLTIYRSHWMFDPAEEKKLSHAQLCSN